MEKPEKLKQMDANLAARNANRLAEQEQRIERYANVADGAWYEIGRVLSEIRAEKNFDDKTFEAYVKRRWSKTRDWAYKLMEGFEAKKALPEHIASEITAPSQATALAAAPEEEREEIVREVKNSGDGKVTAKKIAAAVTRKKAIVVDAEVIQYDELEKKIPKEIVGEWNRAKELGKELSGHAREIMKAIEGKDPLACEVRGAIDTVKSLLSQLKNIVPYAICPVCKGARCKTCGKRGFVSKFFYNQNGKKK